MKKKMSNSVEKDDEISKTAAKRKFLLTDEDLAAVPFKMKPNPMNKGYAPMKVYDKSNVEKIAMGKHGSLEEIKVKQNQKSHATRVRIENKDEETRSLWDSEEIYEPMKQFMIDIDLPAQKTSSYFRKSQDSDCLESSDKKNILIQESSDDLLKNDIIIHYFDCVHHRAKGAGAYAVHHKFPKAAKMDQETPYNDRRKMGHFCWFIADSNQLFPKLAPNRPVVPVMNYDALHLGLKRLANLLGEKMEENDRSPRSLTIGTYLPYKVDETKFTEAYNKTFEMPVHLYTGLQEGKT